MPALGALFAKGGEYLAIDKGVKALENLFTQNKDQLVALMRERQEEINNLLKVCRPAVNDFINVELEREYGEDGKRAKLGFRKARHDRLRKLPLSYRLPDGSTGNYEADDENKLDVAIAKKLNLYLLEDTRKNLTQEAQELFTIKRMFGPALVKWGILAETNRPQFDEEVETEIDDIWPKRLERLIDELRPQVEEANRAAERLARGIFGRR